VLGHKVYYACHMMPEEMSRPYDEDLNRVTSSGKVSVGI